MCEPNPLMYEIRSKYYEKSYKQNPSNSQPPDCSKTDLIMLVTHFFSHFFFIIERIHLIKAEQSEQRRPKRPAPKRPLKIYSVMFQAYHQKPFFSSKTSLK